jgi:phage terminase small subunit
MQNHSGNLVSLTTKQERFVEEYLIDLNATQAAIRAGYAAKTANREGSRLLSKVDIQEAIAMALEYRSERVELTQDWVVERLKVEAEQTGEGSTHSARVQALTQLGRHLGMFNDKLNIDGLEAMRELTDEQLDLVIARASAEIEQGAGVK